MNISMNSHFINKKKSYVALAQFSITQHYTKRKFCYNPHSNLNFVSYALQLNKFSFSHLICRNKLINFYPR